MRGIVYALIAILLGGIAYVRLAPDDPERWHVDPLLASDIAMPASFTPDPGSVHDATGGAWLTISVRDSSPEALLQGLDDIAMATPGTARLAGNPGSGRITWVTRSAIFGFPDYTTAQARKAGEEVTIDIYARQRYGLSDLGVNAARLQGWLTSLASGQGPGVTPGP